MPRRSRALVTVALAAALCACAGSPTLAAADGPRQDRPWRIVPRLGFSYATGMLGVEAQGPKVGVGAGLIVTPRLCILCSQEQARKSQDGLIRIVSARYFLREAGDGWAVGPFYARENSVLGGNEFIGAGAEYVLRGGDAWQLGVGFALARQSGHSSLEVLPSLAIGYAF